MPTERDAKDAPASAADIEAFVDDALGKLGGVLGEMGYTMPQPVLGPLDAPSGRLLLCDLGAIPRPARRGRILAVRRGRTVTRGLVVERAPGTWNAFAAEAIPGQVQHLMLLAKPDTKAARERVLGLMRPQTGTFLVSDATLLPKLARAPRKAPALLAQFGARETVFRIARENGARLTPDALRLLDASASSGAWVGVLSGRDALVVHLGHRHPLRLREGLDEKGETVYLRIDALQDAVQADPRLRAMAKAERGA